MEADESKRRWMKHWGEAEKGRTVVFAKNTAIRGKIVSWDVAALTVTAHIFKGGDVQDVHYTRNHTYVVSAHDVLLSTTMRP